MILKATSSIIIFLLDLVYFLNSVSGDCSPVVTGPACENGWEETPRPRSCIQMIQTLYGGGKDAFKACALRPHSSAWMSYNKAQNEHLTNYIERLSNAGLSNKQKDLRNPWIGLNDNKTENKWVWPNGQKLRESEAAWGKEEPNGAKTQQCVYITFNKTWLWADDFCKNGRFVVCQTLHQIGPREINMTLEYHAPKRGRHIIYRDTPLKHTCSAFLSEGDDDLNLKVKGTNFADPETHSQNHENSLGMCTKRTFRTWSVKLNSPSDMKSYKVDCFTRKIDQYDYMIDYCGDKPNSFCKTFTFPSVFIDPPEIKPIIAISNVPNNKVLVNCTVNVGETGKLTWVVFMTSETKILRGDDFYIHHGSQVLVKGEKKKRWLEKSSLLLPRNSKVDDAIIACFDHNITRYSFTTTCDPEDLFCASIKMIEVTGQPTSSSSTFLWLLFSGLLLIILLSIVVAILVCQREPAAARKADGEEGRPADKIDDGAQEETPVIAEVDINEGSLVDGDKYSLQSKGSRRNSKNSEAKSAHSRRPSQHSSAPGQDPQSAKS